jgi:hypothetical protein
VDVLNNLQSHAKAFGEVARVMDAILKVMKSKETLKEQFLFILDGYIRSREAFGMMTSGREKDELIAITKEQVRLL